MDTKYAAKIDLQYVLSIIGMYLLPTCPATYLPSECSKSALAKLAMVSSTMSITP